MRAIGKTRTGRSASKPTTPLNSLRGAIGQRKNWGAIRNALSIIKNESNPLEFVRLYTLASASTQTTIAIPASKKITKPGFLQSIKPLETSTLAREVAWAATILAPQRTLIASFCKLREAYLDQLMSGKTEIAEELLNEIDNKFGASLWSIENRIALQTQRAGFEATKNSINKLTEGKQRSFFGFFANQIGERNETRVSRTNYEQRLREKVKAWRVDPGQEDYLLYKLAGFTPKDNEQIANIICYEGSSSPIDYYETVVDLLPRIVRKHPSQENSWINHFTKLPTEDFRLRNISNAATDFQEVNNTEPDYLNSYLSGDLENGANRIREQLAREPNDSLALVVCALMKCQNSDFQPKLFSDFQARIVQQINHFLLHESSSDDAAKELDKIALNYRHLPIANYIESILEATSTNIVPDVPIETCIKSKDRNLATFSAQLTDEAFAKIFPNLEGSTALQQYLNNARRLDRPAYSSQLLSHEARQYSEIHRNYKLDDYRKVLENLEALRASPHQYHRTSAEILRTWILFESGEIEHSIVEAVRLGVSNTVLLRSLPLSKIFEKRGFRELKTMKDQIALAIGFYLYRTLTKDSRKDVALKVAWKQFHEIHGAQRPSELISSSDAHPRDELIFFLKYVCTQEVMEISSAFDSPSDLDKERLNICIILSKLDPDNTNEYNSEIIELTRRQSIEDGVQQIESSRIYVDEIGIQRWSYQNLSESFLRYIDYSEAGLNASGRELEIAIASILRKSGITTELINFLDGYDVSTDSLLAELIESIAEAFLTLPRFGLDAFLGSRVRHGSLEGAFRNPLLNRRLITKIDSTSNQYESNLHWIDGTNFKNKQQRNTIDRILINFSKNFDQIIDNAVNRLVHVKSKTHPDGLFSLWPSDESTRRALLKSWIINSKLNTTKETTIEQFVDYCINTFFWPQLRYSLENAGEYVTNVLAAQLQNELDHLRNSIRAHTDQLELLAATIDTAKSDVSIAAQKVAKWFSPPQSAGASSSYLLKTGIEIGITSLRHIQPRFQPAISWSVDERANVLLHPHAFQVINDVAFLIFGNILQHSGHFSDIRVPQAEPKVHIEIGWSEPSTVQVEVRNAIAPGEDIDSIIDSVDAARQRIQQKAFDSVTKKTKNTGLVRLASTLNYEQSDEKQLEFGVTEDNEFRVFFSVPEPFLTGNQNVKENPAC